MSGLQAFLDMGGYGGFIWPAYGLGLVLMAGVLVQSVAAMRKAEHELGEAQELRRARRGAKAGGES